MSMKELTEAERTALGARPGPDAAQSDREGGVVGTGVGTAGEAGAASPRPSSRGEGARPRPEPSSARGTEAQAGGARSEPRTILDVATRPRGDDIPPSPANFWD